MSFQAPFSIMDYADLQMKTDMANEQRKQQETQALWGAVTQLAGAYGDWKKGEDMVGAMDKGVGMMSDIGAVNPDVRDKFMNLDKREKPFVFDLLRQGMFAPYAAGQSAGFQAQAWDKYRQGGGGGGGGMPSGARNQYGYFYQGP
jgi:hypothetical protein